MLNRTANAIRYKWKIRQCLEYSFSPLLLFFLFPWFPFSLSFPWPSFVFIFSFSFILFFFLFFFSPDLPIIWLDGSEGDSGHNLVGLPALDVVGALQHPPAVQHLFPIEGDSENKVIGSMCSVYMISFHTLMRILTAPIRIIKTNRVRDKRHPVR